MNICETAQGWHATPVKNNTISTRIVLRKFVDDGHESLCLELRCTARKRLLLIGP